MKPLFKPKKPAFKPNFTYLLLIAATYFSFQPIAYGQCSYPQYCSVSVYDNWLKEQCGNYAYNGDLSLPVDPSTYPDGGGGNVWQSCMWTTYGSQNGYTGNKHGGTPDLFLPNNANYLNNTPIHLGVPNNSFGSQNDHTTGGANQTGYLGLYTWFTGNSYREFIIGNFPFHLTAGVKYTFSFWVSLSGRSNYATHINAWVGRQSSFPFLPGGCPANPVTFPGVNGAVIGATRVFKSGTINNTGSWTQLSFDFQPTVTGEYYLVLGNYDNNAATPTTLTTNPGNLGPYVPAKLDHSYYYIDDIKVTGDGPEFCCSADYKYLDNTLGNDQPNSDIYWSNFPAPPAGLLGASAPWGSTFYVNGNLHIDQDVNLYFVDMKFSPGSSLIIDPGVTFNTKFSYLHGCPRMWNGITSSSPTATIDMLNNTVTDAWQAIGCTNGVPVTLKNNTFRNNLNGVKLSNFAGTWPLTMTGNEFRCTSTLLAPLSANYSNLGVEVSNVGTVGLSQSGLPNRFTDLQTGVLLSNVNANVSNLRITTTGVNPINAFLSMGISVYSGPGNLKFVNISNYNGLVDIRNTFNGIHFFGNFYNLVENCKLENIKNEAISFENNAWYNLYPTEQIKCRSNNIRNARIGVSMREIYNTRLRVDNNLIVNDGYIKNSIGINFVNTKQTNKKCNDAGFLNKQSIEINKVNRFEIGVNTEQCNCLTVNTNEVNMKNNFGFFTQFHGIWSKSCTNGQIGLNNVNGGNLSPSSCIGIRLLNNNTERVFCNTVDSNDFAFWLEGSSTNTIRLEKNILSEYKNGFYFTGSLNLNNQLEDIFFNPQIHQNEWVNKAITGASTIEFNTAPGLNMTGTTFYFLFGDPNLNTRINDIQTIGSSPALTTLGASHAPNCGLFIGEGGMVVSVLEDSTNLHWDTASVFGLQTKWLTDLGTALTVNNYADTIALAVLPQVVQANIDTINNFTTCPKTILVDKYIGENDFINADIANASIDNSCSMGSLYKEFNDIVMPYLEAYRNMDTVVIDSMDKANILEIANLCLYQYGQVVSSARSFTKNFINDTLTFLNPCEVPVFVEPRSTHLDNTDAPRFNVYPVPATDYLVITSSITDEINYSLYDMQGKLLLTGKFFDYITINIENIAPGNYVLRLYNAAQEHKEKIIISR